MTIIKAKCVLQYGQLKGVLDVGDIVEIEPILLVNEIVLIHKWVIDENESKKSFKLTPDVVAPIGTMIGWRFKSKNNNYYDDVSIRNSIGNVQLNDLFEPL